MGCQNCKIPSELPEDALDPVLGPSSWMSPSQNGLFSKTEKKIWLDSLSGDPQPETSFTTDLVNASHSCFKQIKKDVGRTFATHSHFLEKNNLDKFQRVLNKFAVNFPAVGYTQGLNFLAGYLLIAGFTQDEAFNLLAKIMTHSKLLTIGLYQDQFPLNRLYCALFWKLLQKRQPNTALKIKLLNVADEIWIFQWFMTFFLYTFPVQFVKRMFDYIIIKKQFSIVCLTLGIINSLKVDINNLQNPDQSDFFQLLGNFKSIEFCEAKINVDAVIDYANSITKYQICRALEQIKLPKNIYYIYFRRQKQRPQMHKQLLQKLAYQRRSFTLDPRSSQYIRDINSIQHLQRLLLRKQRLYRSRTDSRFSSQIRTSNYTVDLDLESIQQTENEGSNRGGRREGEHGHGQEEYLRGVNKMWEEWRLGGKEKQTGNNGVRKQLLRYDGVRY